MYAALLKSIVPAALVRLRAPVGTTDAITGSYVL